ncbi:hypothetical protein MBH78_13865 [Oceanimonas sp. NS1]|uniref:Uncharacterized protein n=1 Tax=Oceanimonas doudoroffii TaxID=84158 RepID=A0A233RI04_9GAMM|nr:MULTISPECIES: hypothetical protein [Oceanimonas]MCT7655451.1 hypothetical protein [Oceanimonas sp. NS1]NHI00387.1 hypothetical protein [Oceanimonas sp. MB9]OXY83020.1 hypothetical protein B6S08_05840 [Oceanimonas doudoroffii]
MHRDLREEQQMLQLKAEALRLKLLTQQARRRQQPGVDWLALAEQVPKVSLAWRLATSPRRLRNKLLLGAGLLALIWWRL